MKTKHVWHVCNKGVNGGECEEGPCIFCGGGIALCTVCGGGEGTLTVDCCERRLTDEEEKGIYEHQNINFIQGKWVRVICHPHMDWTKDYKHMWE
jgi:hypothetical protein